MPPKRKYTGLPMSSAAPRIDLTGQRYGRLVVVRFAGAVQSGTQKRMLWDVRCDCGKTDTVKSLSMRNGATRSCGCLHTEVTIKRSTKHGLALTPEHNSWRGMMERCNRVQHISYENYGGRGIRVCERWANDFTTFLADMGKRPLKHSIDRINTNGHYTCGKCDDCVARGEPFNCRWATSKQQAANQRPKEKRDTTTVPMLLNNYY